MQSDVRRAALLIAAAIALPALWVWSCGGSQEPITVVESADGDVSFQGTVLPILEDHCAKCHGRLGALSVETYDDVMKGGAAGPVVVPGDPDGSSLVQYIDGRRTPQMPKFAKPLTADRTEAIRAWIAAGAKDN